MLGARATPEATAAFLSLLPEVPAYCLQIVPPEWQISAASLACSRQDLRAHVPGVWSVRALEVELATTPVYRERLECLAEHGAMADQGDAGTLARILAAASTSLPMLHVATPPDDTLLSIVAAVLRMRPPSDLPWWRSFWDGMSEGGAVLRGYLYLATGQTSGVQALWPFIAASIEWENPSTDTGVGAATQAGFVLRRFQGRDPPALALLLPASPRMGQVVFSSTPTEAKSPYTDRPWFASEEAQQRIGELWNDTTAGTESDRATWRGTYIANQWALAGYEVTLHDLQRAFADVADPIPDFEDEQRVRFQAGLLAYAQYLDSADQTLRARAAAIRSSLAAAIRRASPNALVGLVFGLRPVLGVSGVRGHLSTLLVNRLQDLPDRVRSLLTG